MVRLLDVVMQNAWSLTALVKIWRRAKAKSTLHLPRRVLFMYQTLIATASKKISLPLVDSGSSRDQNCLRLGPVSGRLLDKP